MRYHQILITSARNSPKNSVSCHRKLTEPWKMRLFPSAININKLASSILMSKCSVSC